MIVERNICSLPSSFYQPETRCNYHISGNMKKVWAIELDLLRKFTEVCEKHGLNYFMDGGTLLGAVRHKGFIPWDDDADVIMPREDYDKLWLIASEEFRGPYFFQTTLSEEKFFFFFSQLRNSNTTGFVVEDQQKDINKGIFIDIFVLDNIPDNKWERKFFQKKIEFEKRMLTYLYDVEYQKLTIKKKLFYLFVHLFFSLFSYKKFFIHFNVKSLGKYANVYTKLVGDITLEWRTNVQWKREWFEDYIYLPFENLMLRAPKFYKEVLTRQYGDFMKLPTDITAPNFKSHGKVIFDPDTPYVEYIRNLLK